MKKDQLQNLREKSKEDLLKERQTFKDTLWQLRGDLKKGKVKNIREVRNLKKAVAVINTLLNQ